MGKTIHVYLTDAELENMKALCDATGDNCSRIVKLAIKELHLNVDTLESHRPRGEEANVILFQAPQVQVTSDEHEPQ